MSSLHRGLAPLLVASLLVLPGLAWSRPVLTEDLPLARLFSEPPLQGRVPRQATLSPGGRWIGLLRPSVADSEVLELWAQPAVGGTPVRLVGEEELLAGRAQRVSQAERAALERKRIGERGVVEYHWCGRDDDLVLVPFSGDLYAVRLPEAGAVAGRPEVRRLTFDEDVPERDPACSPDGRQVAFVRGGDLWVQALAGGDAHRLTDDATDTTTWGLAEFIAGEEFARDRGFWWSPDGRRLLALHVDEIGVLLKARAQIYADRTLIAQQRYPAAGSANAKVTAFAIEVDTAARLALPLPADAEYVARADWFDDGAPWVQVFTRDQTRLSLIEFDPLTGVPRIVTEERDADWVVSNDDLAEVKGSTLSGKPALLWSSEATGRRQLVLVDRVSGARRPLTAQPEAVAGLVCTDGERVVFEGATERGRGRELFAVTLAGAVRPLAGAAPRQWRTAVADKACTRLLVKRSAWGEPLRTAVLALDGHATPVALAQDAGDAPNPRLPRLVPVPRPVDIVAADGRSMLNAFYFPPLVAAPARASRRHPLLVLAYGGPGASTVAWRWSRDTLLIAWWQRQGYGVFMVDTRGMADRDRDFTRAHRHAFGRVEVDDLFGAVRQLAAQDASIDPARVGFFGWSYGGYLAARAMLDERSPFAAAVAVAPVADWTLYDTAYTERYLGLPTLADGSESPVYRAASLLPRAGLLRKPLLLVHGTADDNVLFEHTLRLIEALQAQQRLFDLDIYPGKAHGITGRQAQQHLYATTAAFLARSLRARGP